MISRPRKISSKNVLGVPTNQLGLNPLNLLLTIQTLPLEQGRWV